MATRSRSRTPGPRRQGRDIAPEVTTTRWTGYERQHRPYNGEEKVGTLSVEIEGTKYEAAIMLGMETWVGRSKSCDIAISSPQISKYHLKLCAVRTSTSQVVVSLHDLSTNGYSINGVLRPPQKPVKLHKTAISTRTAVLCDGDVISFPEIDIDIIFKQRRIHTFSAWPEDLTSATTPLFPTADPSLVDTVGPWSIKNYPLGHGTFGLVYLAENLSNRGIQVACKTADLSVAAKHQTSIKREVEVLKVVDHPNVCGILDTDAGDGEQTKVLLFMPLVLGGDLFSYMEKHNHLTEDEVRFAAKQLVEGVAYLHKKKIAHRDIKPENILLRTSSAYPHLLLADFGLALTYSDILDTVPQNKLAIVERKYGTAGTEPYMPPEQLAGVLGRNLGIQGFGESIHGRDEWRAAVADRWFGDEMAWDKWSLGVVLYQLLSGMHPYDHSVDQDAPGEELEEGDLQSQMKKMTSAQSWKAYRSAKGQGTLKINRTERDETRSRMYEAACRFATNGSETWTPHESWAGVAEEGKAFVKSLTHASPTKRAALSTLLKGAWFEPVRKELDDMYDIVVNHGRLARGLGRSRPGLGAISHAASQNDASHVGTAMQANVTPDKHSTTPRVLVPPSDPSSRYKGKSKSKRKAGARAEEAEEEEAVDEAGETVQSLIKVKPSKRRKVIESVAETALAEPQDAEEPEENEQQRTDEDADKSGSSPDSAPAPVKGKGKGDKGKAAAQGSGRGKDKAASTPTATKHSAAGKKGKGKAPAQPPLESVPETPHSQVQQNELDFFPSASQQRTSLFLPSSGIFGPQVTPTQPQHHQPTQKQRSLPDPSPATLATVARALTTMGKGVSETPEQAHTSTSDTDSDNASKNINNKTTNNRKKISLAPAPAAAGNAAISSTFKTPNATSKTHTPNVPTVKKAAPIAIKSKSRATAKVGTSSTSKSSTRSAFAPASGLDVELEE